MQNGEQTFDELVRSGQASQPLGRTCRRAEVTRQREMSRAFDDHTRALQCIERSYDPAADMTEACQERAKLGSNPFEWVSVLGASIHGRPERLGRTTPGARGV
jgi:hypothetical protein